VPVSRSRRGDRGGRKFNTNRDSIRAFFAGLPPLRVAFEVSAHLGWGSELLNESGHADGAHGVTLHQRVKTTANLNLE